MRFNVDANPGVPIRVFALALGEATGTVILDINRHDRGGTRTRPLDDRNPGCDSIRVECRPLLQVLMQEDVKRIDALKIDVEGAEATILAKFFHDAPDTLWPQFIIIEDTSGMWQIDLFSKLAALGYMIERRTKLNVMMRR